jgi:glutaredoxin
MNTITVYTKPACVQCNAVLRALEKAAGFRPDRINELKNLVAA